jgi:YHYH protein
MTVKISSIVDNQFPEFMRQESPLLVDFIKQYYISGEYSGAPFDLISNLGNYTKLENLTHLVENTVLSKDISFSDSIIAVESTKGFPDSYGLLLIDSEIITYSSKTETSFNDCSRGFRGISNYELEFSVSESDSHTKDAKVENLSIIFLSKFLEKLKKQFIPGFEGREFNPNVNESLFIEKSRDFYSVKGTEKAFEILFGALYGEKVKVIKPRDYLFSPSAAEYRVTKDLVVEPLIGDPLLLENRTLFQDKTDQFPKASGSISKVEKIIRNDKDYYIISLDYDFNKDIDVEGSIFGEFSIHPKTKITSNVSAGSSAISVDSTVGFPSSGYLILNDFSLLSYTSKSLTQFLGCGQILVDLKAGETVRVDSYAYGFSGSNKNNIVTVSITGVIENFEEIDTAYNLLAGDVIRPETLGKQSTSVQSKSWIYNLPISYLVKSVILIDAQSSKYKIETFDDNIFGLGDPLSIVLKDGTVIENTVYANVNSTTFIVQEQRVLSLSNIDHIERNISYVKSNKFKELEIYSANVQNVYEDLNKNTYVASPSLPFYFDQPLDATSRGVVLSGSFSGEIIFYPDHGFLTGDVVLYNYPDNDSNLGLNKGTYYVKKIDRDNFSLSTSRSNLRAEIYLNISGKVKNNTLEYSDFSDKKPVNQKIIRKISQPVNSKVVEKTKIGTVGILANGVEILNYKSENSVFYGPIESVDVLSAGEGYDVINPPIVEITDDSGTGAKVVPEITGVLKEIRLIDNNLIVSGEPTISITGGNGSGAKAKAEVGLFEHSAIFTTDNISENAIGFSTFHNFSNYERVIFKPDGLSKVSGISTNSEYYVFPVNPLSVKLYETYNDAISNSNAISLSVTGYGIHKLVSYEPKTKISSIIVTNSGEGYTNRGISVSSSGINTITNNINFTNHSFQTGELVVYDSYSNSPIVGLQTNTSYYVTQIDKDNFKLSETAGITSGKDFYLKTQQFVSFNSAGDGKHYFNYEPIKVNIIGEIQNYTITPSVGIASTTNNIVDLVKFLSPPSVLSDIGGLFNLGYEFKWSNKLNAKTIRRIGIYKTPILKDRTVGIWEIAEGFLPPNNLFLVWSKTILASDPCTSDEYFCWYELGGDSFVLDPTNDYVVSIMWDIADPVPARISPGDVQMGGDAQVYDPRFYLPEVPSLTAEQYLYPPYESNNDFIGYIAVNLSYESGSDFFGFTSPPSTVTPGIIFNLGYHFNLSYYLVNNSYDIQIKKIGIYNTGIYKDHTVGIWENGILIWSAIITYLWTPSYCDEYFCWYEIEGPVIKTSANIYNDYIASITWDVGDPIPCQIDPAHIRYNYQILLNQPVTSDLEVPLPSLLANQSDYPPTNDAFDFDKGLYGVNFIFDRYDPTNNSNSNSINYFSDAINSNIQPIFRGKISNVFVESGGKNYGQENIINYNRQPNISINSGKDAQLQAIVSNGKITEVLIINPGSGYNSPPDIIINGVGNGAKLTPIIVNGELRSVNIINSGYGYEQKNILLSVVSAGTNGLLKANIKSWTINWVERLFQTDKITFDDGIITRGARSDLGLQYAHGYAPRKLRQILQGRKYVGNTVNYQSDLILNSYNKEIHSDYHSPIIGWAYDGNPIYGPYGYEYKTSGSIKLLKSGYELLLGSNRPSSALYPPGIFVEDYTFTNSGDLDEHNGRYCITPDFPNGTYAYFASFTGQGVDVDGPFKNYFRPAFPYLIGDSYNSKPIDFNFDYYSNQDYIDINKTGWLRNTTPYNFTTENSYYEYVDKPFDYSEQSTIVTSIHKGSVEEVEVISGGEDYQVGDRVVFSNSVVSGANASAEVLQIKGKNIKFLNSETIKILDVEFVPDAMHGVIGFCTLPHNFSDKDFISIENVSYNRKILQNAFEIEVPSSEFILSRDVDGIGNTGITTFIEVYGNLSFPNIRENDILKIDEEQLKVLSTDSLSSRLFVSRGFNSSSGTYHTSGTKITEIPRKFYIKKYFSDFTNSSFNKELYFNPSESIGFGTGIGNTITFSNPGAGLTSIFVPAKTLYYKNHGLNTGDELIYNSNGGSPLIISTSGISTSILSNNSKVYAISYSSDFIGISTQKVSIGSSGTLVGYNTTSPAKIAYFMNKGNGNSHSLKTQYDVSIGEINRNLVSVFVESDSLLKVNDEVVINVKPNDTTIVKVVYNPVLRRLLVNPKSFLASDVDVVNGTIKIPNHGFYNGEKIVYNSSSPITQLRNNGIYYVVVINSEKIGLSLSYYNATLITPSIIYFTNSSSGTISQVNPGLKIVKNNSVKFDLSDSSLSVASGGDLVPEFEFNFFTDDNFINRFETTFSSNSFNVVKYGKIGVDTSASVTLNYDENIPDILYYNLNPVGNKKFVTDREKINNYNRVIFVDSFYAGKHKVTGIGSTSFNYVTKQIPEVTTYNKNIDYTTNSKTAYGPINNIIVTSGGANYSSLPGISSIISEKGKKSIVEARSTTIGQIKNFTINDIGFDYSGDLSISPTTLAPVILKVVPKTFLKSIEIVSDGVNYVFAPDLILIDGLTNNPITNIDLRYKLGDKFVSIYRNSKSINKVNPLLIPINNSNAIGITSISFNSTTKDVSIVLETSYSSIDEFPFAIGDKVLLENISIFEDEYAKGFNSSDYNYSRFEVIEFSPNIGGSNSSIIVSFSPVLIGEDYPGVFDFNISSGSVIPEKFFPQFKVELENNFFLDGEIVSSSLHTGTVKSWRPENELMTISTSDEFLIGETIIGSKTESEAIITKIYDFKSKYDINSSSIVRKGWNTEKGFLNNEFQRIQDSDYYQAFAYSLKSKVDYSTWDSPVSSLTHISGFKKFGDLIVESETTSGVSTDQNQSTTDFTIFSDSLVDLNCVEDYDLVTENYYVASNNLTSNEIYFSSAFLSDYSEAIGNRVLVLDDISKKFDGQTRQFILSSNNEFAFKRIFDGSNPLKVDLPNNRLNLPNHYFTNGEKLLYSHNGSPIGIQTVTIVGLGQTNYLPPYVYVIKNSESTISLAASAENALKEIPIPFVMTTVGIGSSHVLSSLNTNSKALITLGGVIQSPITTSGFITASTNYIGLGTNVVSFASVSNFASGDHFKIDSEIFKVISIGSSTPSVVVERGWAGSGISTHANSSLIYKLQGNYNIVDSLIHFVTPPPGPTPIGTDSGSGEDYDYVGITTTLNFNGRVFTKNGVKNSACSAYYSNYVFDDVSSDFNGISSIFTLKSNLQNVRNVASDNSLVLINEIPQIPSDFSGAVKTYGSYTLAESAGITTMRFLGSPVTTIRNPNDTGVPLGGVIVSIGYSQGFGLQPLISAGGTALVSAAGTIRMVSIGNSGSGYRSNYQTVKVGVYVSTTGITTVNYIGVASVLNGNVVSVDITNPGFGYTSTNPPKVTIDDPLPYFNIPLEYYGSSSGVGTNALVNIKVGSASSIIDLEISNNGYGYKKGDVLTISRTLPIGIPTISSNYSIPLISVNDVYSHKFSGWSFGQLQIIDSINSLFNGFRRSFPIKIDGKLRSIRARVGSLIDIKNTLLIFINGILQIPGDSYNFIGSTFIVFSEAPKPEDDCLVLFYRGSGDVDVIDVEVLQTIKPGDIVKINEEEAFGEDERLVTSINSSDSLITFPYNGPGISEDPNYFRPVKWRRQTEDLFSNQKSIPKNRQIYEAIVEPSTNIIKTVGINTTIIFVENARAYVENDNVKNYMRISSQEFQSPAIATVGVATAGFVEKVLIVEPGNGYTTTPNVYISKPIGLSTDFGAYASAVLTNGSVSQINLSASGIGYTTSPPPQIIIDTPKSVFEDNIASSAEGDFGVIVGISKTSVGVASTGLTFNLFIPQDSYLRDSSIVGTAVTLSSIKTGYYFVVKNSFVGNGITALDENGLVIFSGNEYINSVYRAANVSISKTEVIGIGLTYVTNVTVSVIDNNISGIGTSTVYGSYSWGRLTVPSRKTKNVFTVYNDSISGINSSPLVKLAKVTKLTTPQTISCDVTPDY